MYGYEIVVGCDYRSGYVHIDSRSYDETVVVIGMIADEFGSAACRKETYFAVETFGKRGISLRNRFDIRVVKFCRRGEEGIVFK